MKKLLAAILILTFIGIFVPQTKAQDNAPKPKYLVWEVKVTPSQLDKSLHAIQSQHKFLKEQNYPYSGFVQYTNDGYLWYSTPIQKYADIDEMNAYDEKLWAENPEQAKENRENFEGSYKSVGGIIMELQPELSILPPESAEPSTGQKFRLYEQFYVKHGKEKEFADAVKQYVALRKKHNVTAGFYTLYPTFGPDFSIVYFIDDLGNSAAEHYTENDKNWEKYGEEGQKLWETVKPLLDKTVTHLGWADYDVSYSPAAK